MKTRYLLLSLSLIFSGCKNHQNNKVEAGTEFIRLIDLNSEINEFIPSDIKQTSDGGYIIMGSSPSQTASAHKCYFLKIDYNGNFLWDGFLPDNCINPFSELIVRDNSFLVFCRDPISGVRLIRVTASESFEFSELKYFSEIRLPLYASENPDKGFLILNTDLSEKLTGLTRLSENMDVMWSETYYFNEIFAAETDRHLKKEENALPFITGFVHNGVTEAFYFNAFYEANFSCVFVNPKDGKTNGYSLIGGDRSYAALRTIHHLGNHKFALSRYNRSGVNYLIPGVMMNPRSSTFLPNTETGGIRFPDMDVNSKVISKRILLDGKDLLVYAACTKNKSVSLYFFEAQSGNFLRSKTFSLETPIELGSFMPCSDGGLMVMGTTYIAGRFPKVCVFKVSLSEVKETLNK